MNSDRDDTKTTESMLYDAAVVGCVDTLNTLVEKDPSILTKISLTTFAETPLHISASFGHLNFTKELLKLKPNLASELDSLNRSPLHIAAAEGHMEIAQALLNENSEVCLVKDQDGRIPLHFAAMRGRVNLIQLLISTKHESVLEVLPSGETALHLCVQYNHLEALKELVESVRRENSEFLNRIELQSGNTILHLAVKLKQVETVEYLLSIPEVKEGRTLNHEGYKAVDLVDQLPRDFNTFRIKRLMCKNKDQKSLSWSHWITERLNQYKREWIKEMQGSIMVAASVIATTTFQTAINPPGGVWQETINEPDIDPEYAPFECNTTTCIAGTSVLAHAWPIDYLRFIRYNCTAFLASLSVILLIVGGFPLKNKACIWLLTTAICVTLTFMALTFLEALFLVTPNHILDNVQRLYKISITVWIGLFVLIGAYHTIYFGIWLFRKVRRHLRRSMRRKSSIPNPQFTKNTP